MNLVGLLFEVEAPIRVEHTEDGDLTITGRLALAAQAAGFVGLYLYAIASGGLELEDRVLGLPWGFWFGSTAAGLWARAVGARD